MSTLQVDRLDHVTQTAPEISVVLDYYLAKLSGTKISEWDDDRHGAARLIRLGELPIQLVTGADSGWHSIGWEVATVPSTGATVSKYGLMISMRTAEGTTRPASLPAENDNALGLVGSPTISVRSSTPQEAASWLAELVGGETYREERKHLNMIAFGVRLADHAVEFIASLTGSEHDLAGAALIEHGEGIQHVRVRTSDFFLARRELARVDVRFTQMGNQSLLLEAEHTGRAVIEIDAS